MKNKFNAKKIVIDDITFDSIKEGNYYRTLLILKNAANIADRVVNIERQLRYNMIINGINCGFYKLDFKVEYADGRVEYVDVKGLKKGAAYQIFRLKKKIVEALYKIEIKEV